MRKKILLLLTLLLGTPLALAACGGGGETADTGGEKVSIRIWTHQNDAFNDSLHKLGDDYMAAHPHVELNFETFAYDTYIQTLQTSLPAGTEADILQMFGTWTCSYAQGGNLAEVPDGVISMSEAKNIFFEAPLAGYTCDGKLYGLPQEFNIEYGAVLVNTEIAEAAGVGDISDGWSNFDDFIADAKAMTETQDGVITRAGYNFTAGDAIPFTFFSLIKQAGGDYMNADGTAFTIDTPEGQEALSLMQRMVDAGVVDPVLFNDESNWVGDCYFEEACAMGLVGPWAVADYSGDFPETADKTIYAPLPSLKGDPVFVADSGWGMTVSANSEVQDAAWEFVKFVTMDAENALEWNIGSGTLPALKANTEGAAKEKLVGDFPHFGPFLDILKNGQYIGQLPDRDLLWYDITYTHILNVLQGVEQPGDALEAIEREANESFNQG